MYKLRLLQQLLLYLLLLLLLLQQLFFLLLLQTDDTRQNGYWKRCAKAGACETAVPIIKATDTTFCLDLPVHCRQADRQVAV